MILQKRNNRFLYPLYRILLVFLFWYVYSLSNGPGIRYVFALSSSSSSPTCNSSSSSERFFETSSSMSSSTKYRTLPSRSSLPRTLATPITDEQLQSLSLYRSRGGLRPTYDELRYHEKTIRTEIRRQRERTTVVTKNPNTSTILTRTDQEYTQQQQRLLRTESLSLPSYRVYIETNWVQLRLPNVPVRQSSFYSSNSTINPWIMNQALQIYTLLPSPASPLLYQFSPNALTKNPPRPFDPDWYTTVINQPLPEDPIGYTNIVPWHSLGSVYNGYFTVSLSNGKLYGTLNQITWVYVAPGPWAINGTRRNGRLLSVASYNSDFDVLVFYGGGGTQNGNPNVNGNDVWVILGNEKNASNYYIWQRATDIPDMEGLGGYPLASINAADVLTSEGETQLWWFLHAPSVTNNGSYYVYASYSLFDPWYLYGPVYGTFYPDGVYYSVAQAFEGNTFAGTSIWFSTNGTAVSYSVQYIPDNFTYGSNPYDTQVVTRKNTITIPRRYTRVPRSYGLTGLSNNDLIGPIIAGGIDMVTNEILTDMWVLDATASCFSGRWKPPQCFLCPDCGEKDQRGYCDSTQYSLPCVCNGAWNPSTNCSTCLPGFSCVPGTDPLVIAGASSAAAIVLISTIFVGIGCVRNLRWRKHMKESTFEMDFFVSYDWKHGKIASNNIVRRLREYGFRVWYDEESMGQRYVISMVTGIRKSRAVMVYVTENYCTRPNCLLEAQQILIGARDRSLPFLLICEEGFHPLLSSTISYTNPVRLLAEHNPNAIVTYNSTFGNPDWCRSILPQFINGTTNNTTMINDGIVFSAVSSDSDRSTLTVGDRTITDPKMLEIELVSSVPSVSSHPLVETLKLSSSPPPPPPPPPSVGILNDKPNMNNVNVIKSIFSTVKTNICIVYLEEYFGIVQRIKLTLMNAGYRNVKGFPHGKLENSTTTTNTYEGDNLRALTTALSNAEAVIYCIGTGFQDRCRNAIRIGHRIRIPKNRTNLFCLVDPEYNPEYTEEHEVTALIGLSLWVDLSANAIRDPSDYEEPTPLSLFRLSMNGGGGSNGSTGGKSTSSMVKMSSSLSLGSTKPRSLGTVASTAPMKPSFYERIQDLLRQLTEGGILPSKPINHFS